MRALAVAAVSAAVLSLTLYVLVVGLGAIEIPNVLKLAWQATLFSCTAAAVCGIIWAGANMDDCDEGDGDEPTFEEVRKKLEEFDRERYVMMTNSAEAEERPAALTPAQRDRILCERGAS
jgi:hypothetical protein